MKQKLCRSLKKEVVLYRITFRIVHLGYACIFFRVRLLFGSSLETN